MSLRTVEEQREQVLATVSPLETVALPPEHAYGMTLAETLLAREAIPVFDNSAMDGFAVHYDDVAAATPGAPIPLRVVADVPAGSAEDPRIGAGEAARIMTGAPLPTESDCVVPFEATSGGLDDSLGTVVVQRAPEERGAHVRRAGEDLLSGDTVLSPGALLTGFALSAAAAAGVPLVTVSRRPRVAVISTGSELVPAGTELGRGQIPESNSVLLSMLARETGAEIAEVAVVGDSPQELRDVLIRAGDADAVITSGGVSAGAYEVVKNLLGDQIEFAKVAMQPGKPQGFGRLDTGALLFALPGNPVSAAVSFEVFARPALLAMQGRSVIDREVIRLPAATGWRTPHGRRQYLPAVIDRSDPSRWAVLPATTGGSGSHLAGSLASAEALAIVPADVDGVSTGDPIDVMLLN